MLEAYAVSLCRMITAVLALQTSQHEEWVQTSVEEEMSVQCMLPRFVSH